MIKSANIYWFDEEKGYERELKYCENQRTRFVDEMKGDQRLSHIIFRTGSYSFQKKKQYFKNFYQYTILIKTVFYDENQ